jgi:hypothetical protein
MAIRKGAGRSQFSWQAPLYLAAGGCSVGSGCVQLHTFSHDSPRAGQRYDSTTASTCNLEALPGTLHLALFPPPHHHPPLPAQQEHQHLLEVNEQLQRRVRALLDQRARGRPALTKDLNRLDGAEARYR